MLEHLAAGFGTVTAVVLLLFGAYATIKSRGFAFRALPAAFRQIVSPEDGTQRVSPVQAFAASLAGTIGVGNITGVSVAIALGGAGAVFWMWVSALLCMSVKYYEIRLAVRNHDPQETDYSFAPMNYIRKATSSRFFSGCFALAGMLAALAMGNLVQTNAACQAGGDAFGIPSIFWGILFAVGTGAILTGGVQRVVKSAEKGIPLLGGLFLLVGVAVILRNASALPEAFRQIFSGAFSGRSVIGGSVGGGIAAAMRYGVGNGLFSHEAGLGSAGLVHGGCGANPDRQGLWGIFEVFIDTILISTVSALMILTGSGGGDVLDAAGNAFGRFGRGIVAFTLIAFAFLSVLSWGAYGETCFAYLSGKRGIWGYRTLFVMTPILAAFLTEGRLWAAAETVNGFMMILNLTALIAFRKELSEIGRLSPNQLVPKRKKK